MFSDSIGIYRAEKPEKGFTILCDREVAPWVKESFFHPKQKVKPAKKPWAIKIQFESAYKNEVIPRVMGLGKHAKLLRPVSVREEIAEYAASLFDNHAER